MSFPIDGSSTGPTIVGRLSTAGLGPLHKLDVRDDHNHTIPLRTVSYGAEAVRAMVAGRLNPDLPLITLKHKGETIIFTLRDLKLAP